MLPIAYLGLIVFIVLFELVRPKDTKFDFLSLFHLFFILLYPLPGFFITSVTSKVEYIDFDITRLTIYDVQHTLQVPLAIFITYFLIVFGYYSPLAVKLGNRIRITPRSNKVFWIIVATLFSLGLVSIYVYSSQYGGLIQAIADANFIRSGAVKGQALGFFIRLVYFNFFAAYLIASWLFIKKNQRRNPIVWTLFIVALAASLVSAFLVSARATMVIAIINFYLAYLLYRRKLALPVLIPALLAIALFIVYGKILFYSLSGASEGGWVEIVERFRQASKASSDEASFITSLVKVFSYGFTSLHAAFNEFYPPTAFR